MVFKGEGKGGSSVVANRVQRADYRKLTANQLPMRIGDHENITEPQGQIR